MKNFLQIKLLFLFFLLSVENFIFAQTTAQDVLADLNNRIGQCIDVDGKNGSQCVDLIQYVTQTYYGKRSTGNANNMSNFPVGTQKINYYNGFIPQAGDIFIFLGTWGCVDGTCYGHTGVIESVSADGKTLYTLETNGGGGAASCLEGGAVLKKYSRNISNLAYVQRLPYSTISGTTINIMGNISAVTHPTSQGNNTLVQGQEKNISFTLKNITNYTITRNFKFFLSSNGTTGNEVWNQSITFAPGQSYTYSRNTDASLGSLVNSTPGTYQLYLKGGTMSLNDITMSTTNVACQTASCNPQTITIVGSQSCNPPTTTLSSPSSGTNYNVGQNINLQWSGNGNGCNIQDYQIELTAPNGSATSPTQTTNNFSFTAPSNGLGTWYWRVRTRNANGVWGAYTSSRSFTISQSTTNYTISVSANPSVGGGVTGGGSFSNGSGCSLVATPNTGYTFTNWTENGTVVSTNSTYTFTVSSNRSLVANFTQQGTWYTCPNYNFSPSINSNWNTSSSSLQTSSNKIYRFLAVPGRTYTFKTGCGDGATATFNTVLNLLDNNCNTIASDDNSCESQRSTIQWTCNYTSTNWVYLMVRGFSTSNSGDYTLAYREITPTSTYNVSTSSLPIAGGNTSGSGNYNQGQSCTVTATSNSGYAFSHWSENGTSVSSNASYTFNVTANRSLVANFTQNPTGSGCTGGTQYPGNTLIPSSTWKTQSGMYTGDYSLYRVYPGVTYEWSMCSADGAVANFDSQLTLIRYSDNQIIKFNNDYCGDDAKIIWTSDFYGDVKVLLNTYNCQSGNDWGTIAYRISNPSDYSSVVVSSSPYYMGNVAGEGSFVNGQTVTVTATPNNGYQFASWKENGNVVSTSSTYQFTVNGNRNLVANFTTALGTNETDKEKSEISPNPFNDFLQVSSNTADIIRIQLFDSSGKLVLTKDLSKKVKEIKLNTSKVIKGIYILKINKENKIESIKVIKK